MNLPSLKSGAMIAFAAASLFATACKQGESAPKPAEMKEMAAKVHCQGVNECKGHGGCKSAQNACAGQNGCKGQGFVEMASDDCTKAGGTIAAK